MDASAWDAGGAAIAAAGHNNNKGPRQAAAPRPISTITASVPMPTAERRSDREALANWGQVFAEIITAPGQDSQSAYDA